MLRLGSDAWRPLGVRRAGAMRTGALLAAVQLCSLVAARSLCREHVVRTGKLFNVQQSIEGDVLYFKFSFTKVIRHPCNKNMALYLGKQLFFTKNNFESSLVPLTIPRRFAVGTPEVMSAQFSSELLLLIVNYKVYLLDFRSHNWTSAADISHPVSHLHIDNCCLQKLDFCLIMNEEVFAYMHGELLSDTTVYFSNNGGHSFQEFSFPRMKKLEGLLGGVFYFHSLSQIGVMVITTGRALFQYTDYPLNMTSSLSFEYMEPYEVLFSPGQRGFLFLWNPHNLLVSSTAGQLLSPILLKDSEEVKFESFSDSKYNIHSITNNENEVALLTREDTLYYGSQGYIKTTLIKIGEKSIWSEGTTITFENTGMLTILTPIPDKQFQAFDFRKCLVNIQAILMDTNFKIDKCNVQLLEGPLKDQLYTIDMNSNLMLSTFMIPQPSKPVILLVMVSNPHSLGFQAFLREYENTMDGNIKFKLDIELKQQHHWGKTHPSFTSSLTRPTISSLTVDVVNKPLSCVDLKPVSALISVGCDLNKRIIVQNKISACSKGLLDAVQLQDNYTFRIKKEHYHSRFSNQKPTSDLVVFYQYRDLGCPRLVYYDTPWKPVVELWNDGKFQELVETEYVLLENNGVFTYSYSLTARSAGCVSQPQNWTTVKASDPLSTNPWNRESYVSCHELDEDNPLRWPDVEYQILGGKTDNKLVFEQRNGIYIFFISIVDPYFSYCHLETTFSVYVHGAYPKSIFAPVLIILGLVSGTMLTLWLAYMIPKQLSTETGQRFQGFLRTLCRRTVRIFTCRWVWRWLQARRVQAAN